MQESEVGLERMIESLTAPGAHPHDANDVQVLQTHISVLFFVDDRVYKLKKPVKLDFLDYTGIEKRKRYCEEEVRLNRRVAPKMYLGVLPLTREADGKVLVDGEGEIVDWVVEMVRLPADRMLDALLDRGEIDEGQLERIALVIARFHDRSMTGPSVNQYGLASSVTEEIEENLDQLTDVASRHPEVMPQGALRFLRGAARRFPLEHRDLLEQRVAQWHVREGHGDLHAGNICLVGDEVYVYDCVAFDRRLRCGDVASDLAFLAMDLDHKGQAEASDCLVRAYARATHDPDMERLVAFYKTYRALVRAKVELVTAEDEVIADEARRASMDEAGRYGHLAVGYELPPCLVLTCGLPATGKSVTADYVASRLRASLLRIDPLTKARRRVYREMLERAVESLKGGSSVVVDATFSRRSSRLPFLDAAARLAVPCYTLVFEVPDAVALERITRRSGDGKADVDFGVHADQKRCFEPPDELPEERIVRVSGTATPEDHCQALQDRVIALQRS